MLRKYYEDLVFLQKRLKKNDKKNFRDYAQKQARDLGLQSSITPYTNNAKNVVIGDIKKAKYVFGAHYDTPPRMPNFMMKSVATLNVWTIIFMVILLTINFVSDSLWVRIGILAIFLYFMMYVFGVFARSNAFNFNDNTSGVLVVLNLMAKVKDYDGKVAYVLYDNEEKGLLGSSALESFLKKEKVLHAHSKFISLDCVGTGKNFAVNYLRETNLTDRLMEAFQDVCKGNEYSYKLKKGNIFEMSDYYSFRKYQHAGIVCFTQSKSKKLYLGNIHCNNDNYLDLKNLSLLTDVLQTYISKEEKYEQIANK